MRQFIASLLQRIFDTERMFHSSYLLHGLLKQSLLLFVMFIFAIGFVSMEYVPTAVTANPPSIITYQGKLLEGGASATTSKAMSFLLYDAATGGSLLYTASGTLANTSTVLVTPTSGVFSVDIGGSNTNALNASVFDASAVYLEVWIDGTKLTPRKRVTAVPFAINSRLLNGVGATSTASTSTYIPISNSDGSFGFNTTTISFLFGSTVSTTDLIVGNSITLGGETRTTWPSGGGTAFWVSSSGRMYPSTVSDIVLIGTSSTSTGDIFQVNGNTYISGTSTVVGNSFFLDGNIRFGSGSLPGIAGSATYAGAIFGNPVDQAGAAIIYGSNTAPPVFALADNTAEIVSFLTVTSTFVNNAAEFSLGNRDSDGFGGNGVSGVFAIMDGVNAGTPSILLTGSSTVNSYGLGNFLFGTTTAGVITTGGGGFALNGNDVYVDDLLGVYGSAYVQNRVYANSFYANTSTGDYQLVVDGWSFLSGTTTIGRQSPLIALNKILVNTTTGNYQLTVHGNGLITQDFTVQGDIVAEDGITLGGVTRTSWPSGGAAYWTSTTGKMYPTNLSDVVLIGGAATSSDSIFEVNGASTFDGNIHITGNNTLHIGDDVVGGTPFNVIAPAGGTEYAAYFGVRDASSSLSIVNATSTDSIFIPKIQSHTYTTIQQGLVIEAQSFSNQAPLVDPFMLFQIGFNDSEIDAPNLFAFRNASTEVFTIDRDGIGRANIGINTSSPLYTLTVDGDGYFVGTTTFANSIVANGGITLGGVRRTSWPTAVAGPWSTSSGKVYPADVNNVVLIGTSSTSTASSIFEVNGPTYFSGGISNFVGNLTNPQPVGQYDITSDAYAIELYGDYAYLSRNFGSVANNRIYVLNISDPTNPTLVSEIAQAGPDTGDFTQADLTPAPIYLKRHGDYLYSLAEANAGGLNIFDVSDPSDPAFVRIFGTVGPVDRSLTIQSGKMIEFFDHYMAIPSAANDAIVIVDVSNPENLTNNNIVSRITSTTPGFGDVDFPFHIEVQGNYMYFSSVRDDTISVADISDPSNPIFVDSITGNGVTILMDGPSRFDINGNYLYTATVSDDRMTIIDISDPTDLTYVGSVADSTSMDSGIGIKAIGDYVIVGASSIVSANNIAVIDVSDPSNPRIVKRIAPNASNLIRGALDLRVRGNYLYVASIGGGGVNGGLQIYNIGATKMANTEIGSADIAKLYVSEASQFLDKAVFSGGIEVGKNGLVVYGDTLFGTFSSSSTSLTTTNTLQFSNTALFKTFVTTTDPFAFVFDTENTLNNTSKLLSIRNGGTEQFTVLGNGTVGINSSTPGYSLTVDGSTNVSGGARFLNGSVEFTTITPYGAEVPAFRLGNPLGNGANLALVGNTTSMAMVDANGFSQYFITSVPSTNILTLGNAVSGPNSILRGYSDTAQAGFYFSASTSANSYIRNNFLIGSDSTSITTTSFSLDGDDAYVHDLLGVGDTLFVENDIYIGTSTLRLNGDSSGGLITMGGGSLTIDSEGRLNINTTNNQDTYFGGNVGIGTGNPIVSLDVSETASAGIAETIALFGVSDDAGGFLSIQNNTTADNAFAPTILGFAGNDVYTGLRLQAGQPGFFGANVPIMEFRVTEGTTSASSTNGFQTDLFAFNDGDNTVVAIDKDGNGPNVNVGINTDNPNRSLTVSGTAQFTGDIYGSINLRSKIEDPEAVYAVSTTNNGVDVVEVFDDKLFVGDGSVLEIYSLANPDRPVLISTTSFAMSGNIFAIEYSASNIYVLMDSSIRVYNATDLMNITLVDQIALADNVGSFGGLVIRDNKLFSAWNNDASTPTYGEVSVYDISNPADITIVTTTETYAVDIATYQNGVVYVSDGGLIEYAVLDGNNLQTIATSSPPSGPRAIEILGDTLWVTGFTQIKAYDLSNVNNITETWTYNSTNGRGLHAIGDYLVALRQSTTFRILESNTTSVQLAQTVSTGHVTIDASSYNGRLYVGIFGVGLRVYNVAGLDTDIVNTKELDTSRLRVRNNAEFRQGLSVLGGLNLTGAIVSSGDIVLQSNTSNVRVTERLLFTSYASTTYSDIFVFDTADTIVSTSNYLSFRNGSISLLDLSADGDIDINGSVTIDMSSTTAPTTIGVCKSGADGTYEQLELVECSSTPSDIAEFYESTPDVEAGDIVMLTGNTITYTEELYDPITGLPRHNTILDEKNGTVTRGDQLRKDSSIAIVTKADRTQGRGFGVVSTNPYQVLGRAVIDVAEHPQPIAIMGRVPTKVSLENGEIYPGDFITLSSIPGVGMKAGSADPVVGIALEPYTGASNNKIMVAISDASQGVLESIQNLEQQLSEVYTSLAMNNPATVTINYNSSNNTVGYSGGNLQLAGNSIFGVSTIVSEGATWRISSDGLFVSTVVTDSGSKDLYTLQSESQEIVISGSSALESGSMRIHFDDVYRDIIDGSRDIKITVTLTDEANGVFVKDKSVDGFTVQELQSGTSNATFDWVAIVYRKASAASSNMQPTPPVVSVPTQQPEEVTSPEEEVLPTQEDEVGEEPETTTPATSTPEVIEESSPEEVEPTPSDDPVPVVETPAETPISEDPIEETTEIDVPASEPEETPPAEDSSNESVPVVESQSTEDTTSQE